MKPHATARQIERFENTIRHSLEHPTCVYALNNVERMKAKLHARGFDATEMLERIAFPSAA